MKKTGIILYYILTIVAMLVYLPALLVYIIGPADWWLMGLISIGFPYIYAGILLWLLVSFGTGKKKIAWFLLLSFLAGIPVAKNVFGFKRSKDFNIEKTSNTLRLLQWNCNGFAGADPGFQTLVHYRAEAVEFIKTYNPDIITFQEFGDGIISTLPSTLKLFTDSLGYKYYAFRPFYYFNFSYGYCWTGNAIFSKLPLTDTGYIAYPNKKIPEGIIWATAIKGNDSVKIATTHFNSLFLNYKVTSEGYEPHVIQDTAIINQQSILKKFRYFQPYHQLQANFLINHLEKNAVKYPTILTADLNNVPSSYVYNRVKRNYTDALLVNQFGFGGTYIHQIPNLRIDYCFTSPELPVLQSQLFNFNLSDHRALLIDVEL